MDFERDEIDVAIRFGYPRDDGLYSEPFIREWLTPMVAPDLAARLDPGHLIAPGALGLHLFDQAVAIEGSAQLEHDVGDALDIRARFRELHLHDAGSPV